MYLVTGTGKNKKIHGLQSLPDFGVLVRIFTNDPVCHLGNIRKVTAGKYLTRFLPGNKDRARPGASEAGCIVPATLFLHMNRN